MRPAVGLPGAAGNEEVLPEDYQNVEIPCSSIARSSEVVKETTHGQRFKRLEDLVDLFVGRGLTLDTPKITTCYFGVGAATVATALEIAGCRATRVYAGSLIDYAHMTGQSHPVR